jgi:hypothetical protein
VPSRHRSLRHICQSVSLSITTVSYCSLQRQDCRMDKWGGIVVHFPAQAKRYFSSEYPHWLCNPPNLLSMDPGWVGWGYLSSIRQQLPAKQHPSDWANLEIHGPTWCFFCHPSGWGTLRKQQVLEAKDSSYKPFRWSIDVDSSLDLVFILLGVINSGFISSVKVSNCIIPDSLV